MKTVWRNQMLNKVDTLSDDAFDAEFDKMMNQSPEEFDAAQTEPEETQLDESPDQVAVEDLDTATTSEDTEGTIDEDEQPDEELDTELNEEPAAADIPEDSTEDDPVDPDSQEPTEFDFNSIPRDKIIPRDINVNGMKVKATMDELEAGFKKGMNYTQKMQEIAPHRKDMNLMIENGLTTADLNLLVEAKGGNKEALAKLLATAKVDPIDIEVEDADAYTPKDYSKDVPNADLEQLKTEILSDQENAPVVDDALKTMPQDMYDLVSENPQGMNSLYTDVKSGIYQKIMPEVIKQQALYGKNEPTLDTYLRVAKTMMEQNPTPATDKPIEKQVSGNKELNNRRRKAGTAPASKPKESKSFIQKDLNSMDDDEFEKEFQEMVGRSTNDFR